MNKEESKQSIRAILEKIDELRNDIHRLMLDTYEAAFEIKPYEGKDELTSTQKELFAWFSYLNGKALDEYLYIDKTRERFNAMIL